MRSVAWSLIGSWPVHSVSVAAQVRTVTALAAGTGGDDDGRTDFAAARRLELP